MAIEKKSSGVPDPELVIKPGKVPAAMIERLLSLPRRVDPRVLVGPVAGEDAAVVDLDRGAVVVTTDPITFPTPRPGYYAVHVNANDVAVMGAQPLYFTLTLIMPPGTTFGLIEAVFKDAVEAGDSLGVVLIGGHSEVTEAVRTPVLVVSMFGRLTVPAPLCTGRGRPGDSIVQVGPLAVEGTSILAARHRERLTAELGAELVERAAGFLYDPGLSVVAPARLAAEKLEVGAMHDPTEGGLATGLREIAQASGTGLEIRRDRLILAEETIKICRLLGYDPLGLISSGCLLFTVPGGQAKDAVLTMTRAGYPAAEIGRLTDRPGEYMLDLGSGRRTGLPGFDIDELARGG
ncbi:MAG: AIR synthase family protein [Thermodesulfobacteriota bacterium]